MSIENNIICLLSYIDVRKPFKIMENHASYLYSVDGIKKEPEEDFNETRSMFSCSTITSRNQIEMMSAIPVQRVTDCKGKYPAIKVPKEEVEPNVTKHRCCGRIAITKQSDGSDDSAAGSMDVATGSVDGAAGASQNVFCSDNSPNRAYSFVEPDIKMEFVDTDGNLVDVMPIIASVMTLPAASPNNRDEVFDANNRTEEPVSIQENNVDYCAPCKYQAKRHIYFVKHLKCKSHLQKVAKLRK